MFRKIPLQMCRIFFYTGKKPSHLLTRFRDLRYNFFPVPGKKNTIQKIQIILFRLVKISENDQEMYYNHSFEKIQIHVMLS